MVYVYVIRKQEISIAVKQHYEIHRAAVAGVRIVVTTAR